MKNKWISKYENLDCPNCKRSIREIYDADSDTASSIEEDIIFCPFCGSENIVDENEEIKMEDNQLTYEELILLKVISNITLSMRYRNKDEDGIKLWERIINKLDVKIKDIEK